MEVVKGRSLLFDAARRIYRNRLAMIMFVILFIYILMALYSAFDIGNIYNLATSHIEDVNRSFIPPFQDKSAPFGTDIFGRNVLYRAVYGSKISMYLGFLTILIEIPIAIIMGALAGYYGGFIDDAIQYLMSIIYSVPGLINTCFYFIGWTIFFNNSFGFCSNRMGWPCKGYKRCIYAS